MGFVASSTDLLVAFAAVLLPAVFLLGLFTVMRLVESALESIYCLTGIARIRAYYRTLAFFGTTAAMIAVINNVVAGVGVALLARLLRPSAPYWPSAVAGIAGALLLTWAFYAYQSWRFQDYDARAPRRAEGAT